MRTTATAENLHRTKMSDGRWAWALVIENGRSVGEFTAIVRARALCDEVSTHGMQVTYRFAEPVQQVRTLGLLEAYNTFPWPEEDEDTPITIRFWRGEPNPDGLTVEAVLAMSDEELEDKHDWIQWAFPNPKPSQFNPTAPTLTKEEWTNHWDQTARENMVKMAWRYWEFLKRTHHWRHRQNHNHLRITRMLTCRRMTAQDTLMEEFYEFLLHDVNSMATPRTLEFWETAVYGEEE